MTMMALPDYVAQQAGRVTMPGAQPYFVQGSTGIAFLALHGWSATAESLRFLAEGLAKAGHTVLAPTLPGHGTTPDDMTQFGPVEWSAAGREAVNVLRSSHAQVFVLGVSMGGALAIQLAGSLPQLIDGVITVNAPVFFGRPEFAREIIGAPAEASLAGWSVPAFMGPTVPEISYPERRKRSGSDIYAMCGLAREILPLVFSPLLVFQSVNDPVVPKECADEILAKAGSAQKRVVWLEQSYHVSQLDLDRDLIVQASLDFAEMANPT